MTKKFRTLVVDDMALARRRVKRYLKTDVEIEIVGECANGHEAISSIQTLAPDLVFLDVQMPEMDGFEVLEALTNVRSVNIRHGISLYQEVQHFERDLIQQALERTGGHQTHAARLLGLNLTTLHNKIKRYQIRVVDWEESESVIEASGAQQ